MTRVEAEVPTLPGFNPLSPDYLRDPYPILSRSQHEQPVFYVPEMNLWIVTRYDDIIDITKDWETFSQSAARLMPVPPALRDRTSNVWFEEAFMNADPPVHTVARKVVNSAFTRGRIRAMVPVIESIADDLIDQFVDDGHCEFMSQFAYPMGATTLARFVGLPVEDMPRLKAWAQDLLILAYPRSAKTEGSDDIGGKPMIESELEERWTRMAECREYLAQVIADHRAHPREDLISTLLDAKDEDGEQVLSDGRIITHLIDLIAAGTDTVAPLMAHTLRYLIENPEQYAALKADPSLVENAVEEGLRARGTGSLLFRYTTRNAQVAGVTIPKGSVVGLSYAGAGRDETHFACPHQYDLHRENAGDHLAFGRGRHFCIGGPLARAEAQISLAAIVRRLPNLALVPDQVLDYHPAIAVFMLKQIEFQWTPADGNA